ncbi:hypothetical protein LEP1GSC088_1742 [Leptospira interrogans str. L1207]|nr:hypothetical protein LEP1GSC088_1742 [Leptospira interrogans str. L1207]
MDTSSSKICSGFNQKKKHSISYSEKSKKPLIGKYKGKLRRWVVERTNSWHNRIQDYPNSLGKKI